MHCAVRTALLTAVILGIICSVCGVYFASHMLDIMSVPVDIYNDALIYCQIYFSGLWSMILYNMIAGILRAYGDSKRPLYVLILSSLINIAGNFLLVGVFHAGVSGAAAATVLAQIISSFVLYIILIKSDFIEEKRVSSCSSVNAVPYCQFHYSGKCKHNGNEQYCSMGNL